MSDLELVQGAILAGLAASRSGARADPIAAVLESSGISSNEVEQAFLSLLDRGWIERSRDRWRLTPDGVKAWLDYHAAIERALRPGAECPSVPWLTAVRTRWIDALSINYAVDPDALASLLPAPLEPEIFKDRAWVQVLISSLEDMRPAGTPALFGVCFYQVSYRAAVCFSPRNGDPRRGGFFLRSDTNNEVMRAIGNALTEFKFHEFGSAGIVMAREAERLVVGIDPHPGFPGGRLVGVFETRALDRPPGTSRWSSLEELHEPLVECYDAIGIDAEADSVYVLTIDRDPWDARFVEPLELYAEYFDEGPLGGGRSELDSVLHVPRCRYAWLPLRREPLARSTESDPALRGGSE